MSARYFPIVWFIWDDGRQYFGQNLGCLIGNDAIVTKRFVIQAGFFHIPPNYVVERVRRSSKAARGEDLEVKEPVWCGESPAFQCHPTLSRMLGTVLIGYQVVEVCQSRDKRLLAAT
jgi:hypothetical protein